VQVLLFDIDGTLIDAGGAGQSAMEQAIAREFGETRPVFDIPAAGRTDRAIGRDLFDYYSIPATEANWSRYVQTYLSLLPRALHEREGGILPGVVTLLERLVRRDDLFLGLLTGNFVEGARLKLKHYGLMDHFRMGGFGDEHLERDDVARAALATLKGHLPGVDSSDIWVIGDTPSDVRCARAIGARAVAVATGMFSREQLIPCAADVLLNDLTDADDWVSSLIRSV
jgi:phosphoglycolate phosphatase